MELRGKIADTIEAYEKETSGGAAEGPAHKELLALIELPRITADDLATASRKSGNDVLHAAVRAKDAPLITASIRRGADPFVKDMNGNTAESMTNDPSVHALLRQLMNAEADQSIRTNQSPTYRGFLGKWTNMVGGYKMRWFVLKDGILSYYQSPDDEGRHARGSIYLRHVKILADSRDRIRFQIVSQMGSGINKMYLRGSDATESVRWLQMLEKAKRFEQARAAGNTQTVAPGAAAVPAQPMPTQVPGDSQRVSVSSAAGPLPRLAPVAGQPGAQESPSMLRGHSSIGSASIATDDEEDIPDDHSTTSVEPSEDLPHAKEFSVVANLIETHFDVALQLISKLSQMRRAGVRGAPGVAPGTVAPPVTEVEGLAKPVSQLALGQTPVGQDEWDSSLEAMRASVTDRLRLWHEYVAMVHSREKYLKDQVEREVATRQLWEEQMMQLGKQHSELEGNLREAMSEINTQRKALRKVHGEEAYEAVKNESKSLSAGLTDAVGGAAAAVGSMASSLFSKPSRSSTFDDVDDEFFDAVDSGNLPNLYVEKPLEQRRASSNRSPAPPAAENAAPDAQPPKEPAAAPQQQEPSPGTGAGAAAGMGAAAGAAAGAGAAGAAEGGAPDASGQQTAPDNARAPSEDAKDARDAQGNEGNQGGQRDNGHFSDLNYPCDEPGFTPYDHLRKKLPISKDERPSMSLWGILKKNIGKDLTKISFPVAFNEPTSMLQRMAEDMEFSECLDAAALQPDSTRRIAYVAAFAASNYSSTIGRIAKPFNPMLGETFEYARPDLNYRYISEQVSHHPPISACFAESPTWEYMGCVDAKSKFMGRKFEIRPTGVAHARIKVPEDWVPAAKRNSLPRAPNTDDLVMEHYSWNKVTSCVSGFLVGSPTIDHYGDMVVTNHVTGDKCVLSFVPAGWRGADAREIRGKVTDAQGNLVWEIAGRWSSQLVARRVGQGPSELNPDSQVDSNTDPVSSSKSDDSLLLLWRNSKKFPSPFNLTPYAITLNSCPDDLRPWLPPTDCRLRPDLHAFENGKFDEADELKAYLENFQRETRRKREAGELEPHKPRWFESTIEPESNAQFWKPLQSTSAQNRPEMSYWVERLKVGTAHSNGDTSAKWTGSEPIFGKYSY